MASGAAGPAAAEMPVDVPQPVRASVVNIAHRCEADSSSRQERALNDQKKEGMNDVGFLSGTAAPMSDTAWSQAVKVPLEQDSADADNREELKYSKALRNSAGTDYKPTGRAGTVHGDSSAAVAGVHPDDNSVEVIVHEDLLR